MGRERFALNIPASRDAENAVGGGKRCAARQVKSGEGLDRSAFGWGWRWYRFRRGRRICRECRSYRAARHIGQRAEIFASNGSGSVSAADTTSASVPVRPRVSVRSSAEIVRAAVSTKSLVSVPPPAGSVTMGTVNVVNPEVPLICRDRSLPLSVNVPAVA